MIIYFTGTGNSRYAASYIGTRLGDTVENAFDYIRDGSSPSFTSETPYIFVCPTYAWQIPHVFADFIKRSDFSGSDIAYFVMTCGGQIYSAEDTLTKLCKKKGLKFMGVGEIVMPENYIAMFETPNSDEEIKKIMAKADIQLEKTAMRIESGMKIPHHKPSPLGKIMTHLVNPLFYGACVKSKSFFASDKCVSCGQCVTFCPVNGIEMKDGRPSWNGNCTHCMACINKCPQEAIEYGSKSLGQRRYLCPEFTDKGRETGAE